MSRAAPHRLPDADNPAPEAEIHLADRLSPYFKGQVLDGVEGLVDASYRLRYQVYCKERFFLPADDYPEEKEIDIYDPHAVHLGVLNTHEQLVATARLVSHSAVGLPLFDHCTIDPDSRLDACPPGGVVEVSRLAVSRQYNRRAGDHFYSLQGPDPRNHSDRRGGGEIVLALYKTLYQTSKRRGFTHWVMATEKALRRLVTRYGFPLRQIGPESDYYGLVAPHVMALSEFDQVIVSGRIPILGEFLHGLEPQFRPMFDDPGAPFPSHAPDRA